MKYLPGVLAFILLSVPALGQSLPDAPQPKQHRFFDLLNDSGLALSAIAIAGDSISTQRFPSSGVSTISEANPLARPFVGNAVGQAAISSAGFGGVLGGMYLFHHLEGKAVRQGRARAAKVFLILERSTPFVVASVEFALWERNNRLNQRASQANQQACSVPGVVC